MNIDKAGGEKANDLGQPTDSKKGEHITEYSLRFSKIDEWNFPPFS